MSELGSDTRCNEQDSCKRLRNRCIVTPCSVTVRLTSGPVDHGLWKDPFLYRLCEYPPCPM